MNIEQIDNIFVATNYEEIDLEENPDKSLCRYEFYEIIVRIAQEKYVKSCTSRNLMEAVGRVLNENIFKYSDFVIPGQQWRDDYLWSIEVDDLFKANMASWQTIFNVKQINLYLYRK